MIAGRYQLERELGQGGFGSVYLAYDVQVQRQVALKLTTPAPGQNLSELKRDFLLEGKMLTELRHRSICGVYDFFESNGLLYLVMEYVQGMSLESWIESQAPLAEPVFEELLVQSLKVIGFLHSQPRPIVHRDVKPANFMRTDSGGLVLVDFGISRSRSKGERDTVAIGTPGYASPEQARAASEPASDIYSWACTMFFCATGKHPEQNKLPAFPPLRSLRSDLPEHLELLLADCAALAPEARPTASEALSRLQSRAASSTVQTLSKDGCSYCGEQAPPRKRDLCRECRLSASLEGLDSDAWWERGELLAREQLFIESLKHFEKASSSGYSSAKLLLAKARCYAKTQQPAEAALILDTLPFDDEVGLELARIRLALGDKAEALGVLRRCQSVDSRALYAFAQGKLEALERLASQHPGQPAVTNLLALALRAAKRTEEAWDYLHRAANAYGDEPEILRFALRMSSELHKDAECRLLARKLARIHRDDPLLCLIWARLHALDGRGEQANEQWELYRHFCPWDEERDLEYGSFLIKSIGQPHRAIDVLKRLTTHKRLARRAAADLATAYLHADLPSEAEELLRAAADQDDAAPATLGQYALALSKIGRKEQARIYAQRCLTRDPTNGLALQILGKTPVVSPPPKPDRKVPARSAPTNPSSFELPVNLTLTPRELELLRFVESAEIVTEGVLRSQYGARCVGVLQSLIYKLGEYELTPIQEAGVQNHQLCWRWELGGA